MKLRAFGFSITYNKVTALVIWVSLLRGPAVSGVNWYHILPCKVVLSNRKAVCSHFREVVVVANYTNLFSPLGHSKHPSLFLIDILDFSLDRSEFLCVTHSLFLPSARARLLSHQPGSHTHIGPCPV